MNKKENKSFILKEGKFSIILGNGYYGEFEEKSNITINPLLLNNNNITKQNNNNIVSNENKLMKISFQSNIHNTDIEKVLHNIEGNNKFISIPDTKKTSLYKKSMLYSFISTLKFNNKTHEIILNNYDLYYSFINNEGNYDLQNLFENLFDKKEKEIKIWKGNTTKKVYSFITHILKGINFLYTNKIVHLDIKPENILYNDLSQKKFGKRFKLIDFGFSAQEPFGKALCDIVGTIGYTPVYYNNNEDWLPNNNPNDWSYKGHISLEHPEDKRYLLYKSDIYSFGRTMYYLDYLLEDLLNKSYTTYFCLKRKKKLYNNLYIQQLTYFMTKENIKDRYDIDLCLRFINSHFI